MDAALFKRFIEKVDVADGDACWKWTAAVRGNSGYGAFKIGGRLESAHVISYRLYKGDYPAGLDVMHSCDNRLCVNPNHLSVGTRSQNMKDCYMRGRMSMESLFNRANRKVFPVDVAWAIAVMSGGMSLREAAKQLGVSHSVLGTHVRRSMNGRMHHA